MRHIYPLSAVLRITGFSWPYIRRFIPDPLKPENWEFWNRQEREAKIEKHQLFFSVEVFENFIRNICTEYRAREQIAEDIRALGRQQTDMFTVLLELKQELLLYSEFLTLRDVAEKLRMTPGTLRNKIRRTRDAEGNEIGILELRGLRFLFYKSLRGDWIMNSLDFYLQMRKLGLKTRRLYL